MNRAKLEEAYRARAGMVGALLTCVCYFPLERYETETGHDENCQAHNAILFHRACDAVKMAVGAKRAALFSVWRDGEDWRGVCRACRAELVAPSIGELASLMARAHAHGAPVEAAGSEVSPCP